MGLHWLGKGEVNTVAHLHARATTRCLCANQRQSCQGRRSESLPRHRRGRLRRLGQLQPWLWLAEVEASDWLCGVAELQENDDANLVDCRVQCIWQHSASVTQERQGQVVAARDRKKRRRWMMLELQHDMLLAVEWLMAVAAVEADLLVLVAVLVEVLGLRKALLVQIVAVLVLRRT